MTTTRGCDSLETSPALTDVPSRVCCPHGFELERVLVSARSFRCARRACQRVVFLCSRCDRGNRYCSRVCAVAARRECVRAAGLRYQRSRRGRFKHAARQARYRARCRARQKVTHQPAQAPRSLGNLQVFTECTAPAVITTPVTSWNVQNLDEFGTGKSDTGEGTGETPARSLADTSRAAGKKDEGPPVVQPPAGGSPRCPQSLTHRGLPGLPGAHEDTPFGVLRPWLAMNDANGCHGVGPFPLLTREPTGL